MLGIIALGTLAVGSFVLITTAGWTIGKYNFFQAGKQNINTQWSNLKSEYQRRFDLFMNLVETVKSFKKHEKTTLKEVIQARNMLSFKGDMSKQIKNMNWLDSFFSKLAVVFERYPQLKANEQHNTLMQEIRITEDRINVARTDFNDIVREFNIAVKTFPSSIIANIFHFAEHKYYLNEERTNKVPEIKID